MKSVDAGLFLDGIPDDTVVAGAIPSLDHIEDLMTTPIVEGWRNLAAYIAEGRRRSGDVWYEWAEWLADRVAEDQPDKKSVPAYEAYRDWKR